MGSSAVRDRVRVTRVMVSAVKTLAGSCSPIRAYAGIGLGAYRYDFDVQDMRVIRLGVNAFAGLDVVVSDRVAITSELAFEDAKGPDIEPVFSDYLMMLRVNVGAKIRFQPRTRPETWHRAA